MSLKTLKTLDQAWSTKLRSWSRDGVRKIVLAVVAHSADSFVLVPLFALLWLLNADRQLNLCLTAAYLLSVVLSTTIKYLVRRRRPAGEWGAFYRKTDPFSFPSGHAARTVSLSIVLAANGSAGAAAAAFLWAALVCVSRIGLGVHYLSDIAAGALLGAVIALPVCLVTPLLGLF